MPRIRTIKPELPSDLKLSRVSRDARLTFVYLITQADDFGLVPGSPRQLLGLLYPHEEDVSPADLLRWVAELQRAGQVRRRQTKDGAPVLEIANWERHQRVDNRGRSSLAESLVPVAENGGEEVEQVAEVRGEPPRVAENGGDSRLGPRTLDLGSGPRTGDLSCAAVASQPKGSDRKSKPRADSTQAAVANGWPLGPNGQWQAGVQDFLRDRCHVEIPPSEIAGAFKGLLARYSWPDFERAALLYDAHRSMRKGSNLFSVRELAHQLPAILRLGVHTGKPGEPATRYADGGPL